MDIHLPNHIAAELGKSAQGPQKRRLRIRAGDISVDILGMNETGFSVAGNAPRLRGSVAILDGSRHIADCLIVATERQGTALRYEYKRWTQITDSVPLDYAREENAPVALLR